MPACRARPRASPEPRGGWRRRAGSIQCEGGDERRTWVRRLMLADAMAHRARGRHPERSRETWAGGRRTAHARRPVTFTWSRIRRRVRRARGRHPERSRGTWAGGRRTTHAPRSLDYARDDGGSLYAIKYFA